MCAYKPKGKDFPNNTSMLYTFIYSRSSIGRSIFHCCRVAISYCNNTYISISIKLLHINTVMVGYKDWGKLKVMYMSVIYCITHYESLIAKIKSYY